MRNMIMDKLRRALGLARKVEGHAEDEDNEEIDEYGQTIP